MFYNDPAIWIYHLIFKQTGFEFPFSNESTTDNKIEFIVGKYDGIAKPENGE